jgi:OOP family OmpA-OmpF porin
MKRSIVLAAALLAAAWPALAADPDLAKYKFVPGEKTLYFADFSEVPLNESPTTGIEVNGTAEAADIQEKRWLKIGDNTILTLPLDKYPEELTVEFYLTAKNLSGTQIYIAFENEEKGYWSEIAIGGEGVAWKGSWDKDIPANEMAGQLYGAGEVVPVAVTVSQKKLTAYVNKVRTADATNFFPVPLTKIYLTGGPAGDEEGEGYVAVTGIRVATGIPKIIDVFAKEGKYVSHGIHFKVGSAEVLPESLSVLKEVAEALKAVPALRLRIVGHTDNTGQKEVNLRLSKDRAAAVKGVMTAKFGIDGGRLETDGKGADQPMADNAAAEGRAANRRVEFIKI